MAPSIVKRGKRVQKPDPLKNKLSLQSFINDLPKLLLNPQYSFAVALLLLLLEIFIIALVIFKIPYTEIDWKAYMQEVEGVLNGTLDYKFLKGDTGPLVYPGGFVIVYAILYAFTSSGSNIFAAQIIFAVLYLATLYFVFRLYTRSQIVPPYALIFMCCTSYRIHSIYVLRLFNDPVAVFFLFVSLNCFFDKLWFMGSVLFSFAVSIKMNILLFAPGLLYVLLHSIGVYGAVSCIAICAFVQLIVGLPFLIANPFNYFAGAFDLSRIFLHEWTVNWRFIPEEIFLCRTFHISLLCLHLAILLVFAYKWPKNFGFGFMKTKEETQLSLDNFLFVMFTSNFVGIVFSRSLHYQFYVWYFFTLPHLLWCTSYNSFFKLFILGILELCWNTYPSSNLSSCCLHICHFIILANILYHGAPRPYQTKISAKNMTSLLKKYLKSQ